MNGRIGHLRNHYRMVGSRGAEVALAARLDRVMRERLSAAFEDALDQAFGNDDAVYVLRRVNAGTLLRLADGMADAGLAEHCAERLVGAVVHSIARDRGDGANLVRFDDQTDYITHFIVALLHDSAWGRWYYGAFSSLQGLAVPDALRAVLLDNRQLVPSILGHLHRRGELPTLLAALDERTRRVLWREHEAAGKHAGSDALRPLFAEALLLADQTDLWARARPDGESLFEIYAGRAALPADWRDQRALSVSLFDILRFLLSQGYLRRAGAGEGFLLSLDMALEKLDWLDKEWLRASLSQLLCEGGESALPARPMRYGPTPRQRELLQTLAALVREEGLRLDPDAADITTGALSLLAMLVSRAPEWADDAMAKIMIEHLLTLGRLLRRAASPAEFKLCLRRGDIEGMLGALAPGERMNDGGACAFVAKLGEQAIALAEELAGEGLKEAQAAEGVESDYAGLSLLLRAMLDVRLHLLAEALKYPPHEASALPRFSVLLLALGLRLGGVAASAETMPETIDEGLCLLAGVKQRSTLTGLRGAWADAGAADHARLQAALLRVMAGQRLLSADVMHLYRIESDGNATLLIAGDETARLWPLGRILKPHEEAAPIISAWLDAWEDATGIRPVLVVDERGEGESLESSEAHKAGREALLAAWHALADGRLGLEETDLTIFLVAQSLLRIWARWLRQFSSSSVKYLLDNFIRRRGKLSASHGELLVELERGPLDIVIEMAGYLDELERVPWLEHRRVRYVLRGA